MHELTIKSLRPLDAACTCGNWAISEPVDNGRDDEGIKDWMKYRHRNHLEDVKRQASLDQFKQLAQQIAANLGNGWAFDETPDDKEDVWRKFWQRIKGPDGAKLSLHWNEREKRISVSGEYLKLDGTTYPYSKTPASINVSPTRPPVTLAKDIQRRFIPAYLEAFQRGKELHAKHEAHKNGKQKTLERLAKVVGVEPTQHKEFSIHFYRNEGGYFDLTVDDADSVRMELRSIPVAKVEKIIRIIM